MYHRELWVRITINDVPAAIAEFAELVAFMTIAPLNAENITRALDFIEAGVPLGKDQPTERP